MKLAEAKTVLPQGSSYIFRNFTYYSGRKTGGRILKNSLDLADYLLEKALTAVGSGTGFGELLGKTVAFDSPRLYLWAD